MKIHKAYRYEIKPNVVQRILLAKHAGCARFAYNWGLQKRIELYEQEKKSTNAIEQHRLLNSLKKKEYPWMYEVSKCAPQEALRDLDRAFQNFFRGLKLGQKVGFPTYKSKGNRDSFRLTGTIKVQGKKLKLPRLGTLTLKEISQPLGAILSATVSKEADRWYVSLTVEQEIPEPDLVVGEAIGIDMGLSCFAACSNGDKLYAPKPLESNLKKLRRLSRRLSKKVKGSNNRKKAKLKIARLHRKIRNIRKDFLHKTTTKLARTKSVIVLEELHVQKMLTKRHLSRKISDAGWNECNRMLEYKTMWYGSKLIRAPRFYPSSKLCSVCGNKVDTLELSVRRWQCRCCNTDHDRDLNAAMNLLKLSTGSSPGIYACGDTSGGTSQKLVSHVSEKQEVMNGIFVHKL